MPAKNAIKIYLPGGIYHVYNRGVEKRKTFLDGADYETFEYFVRRAISRSKQYATDGNGINLLAQCLMPNHLHLLVRQDTERAMESFMRSVMNAYVAFFNKKYDRVGPLFQGPYKAVLIESDEQLWQVRQYIRTNPVEANLASTPEEYRYLRESP